MPSLFIPPYSEDVFVNRESEIKLIEDAISRLINKDKVIARTIVFEAERGSGKSWLSLHLHRAILPKIQGTRSLYLCLRPWIHHQDPIMGEYFLDEFTDETTTLKPDQIRQAIFKIETWLADQLGAHRAQNPTIRELRNWIVETVQNSKQVLVLILDSAYESSWDLLKALEEEILGNLAALQNVLVVITGRGRPYIWESPELRSNAIIQRIAPLTLEQSMQMVHKQIEADIADDKIRNIYQVAAGSPLGIIFMVQEDSLVNAADRAINEMLSIGEGYPTKRKELRHYFEALSPLDEFREDEIQNMLIQYYKGIQDDNRLAKVRNWNRRDIRENVRDELVISNLMRWEDGKFIIDNGLRQIIRFYLQEKHPQVWKNLNQEAASLYHQWAKEYPQYKSYYQDRAEKYEERSKRSVIDISSITQL